MQKARSLNRVMHKRNLVPKIPEKELPDRRPSSLSGLNTPKASTSGLTLQVVLSQPKKLPSFNTLNAREMLLSTISNREKILKQKYTNSAVSSAKSSFHMKSQSLPQTYNYDPYEGKKIKPLTAHRGKRLRRKHVKN